MIIFSRSEKGYSASLGYGQRTGAPGVTVRAIFSSLPVVYSWGDICHAAKSHLCFIVRQFRFPQSDLQESG